jgi:opacity protein-like surface antigen
MNVNCKSLFLVCALLGAGSASAMAGGEWGSVKDYAGVPVPAPIPIPMYDPVWYFRADATLGLADAPGLSEDGMVFGEGDGIYHAPSTFGTPASWSDNDYAQVASWGIGIGYRWSSALRTDVTAETAREQVARVVGDSETDLHNVSGLIPGHYDVETDDRALVRGGIVLFNAYYDFARYGWFRPYVGAGLGFGVYEIFRRNDTREDVCNESVGPCVSVPIYNEYNEGRNHALSLAAALMLGSTFQITDITDLDLNYRYLWVDGITSDLVINGHSSQLSVDDVHDHQLRAGLRFNVN